MIVVVVLSSAGVGIGLMGLVSAVRTPASESSSRAAAWPRLAISRRRQIGSRPSEKRHSRLTRVGPPVVSGILVGVVTRWPVAALFAAVAGAVLPTALRRTSSRDATRKIEAIAVWTELLRDTLTTSAGLAQSIVATANVAPIELRDPVAHLANRITSGVPMDGALKQFATEVESTSAHEVVSALRLAATSPAHRLGELLSSLAESTRDEVTMRLRVEASRASARSGVRTVIVFSLGFIALLVVVARSYLSPFASTTGQLVLMFVGLLYALGVTLMVRLVRPRERLEVVGELGIR